jgi:hypothetical protein
MTEVVWKHIREYEKYQISSQGDVVNSKGRILKQHPDRYGYNTIMLCKNGIGKRFLVHRLVAIHFIPNPLNKPTVNHLNGNTTDSRVENLEWATISENNLHAYRTGLSKPKKMIGEKNGRAKLTQKDADKIRLMCSKGIKQKDIANHFNISISVVNNIKNNRAWI